ncbi:ShlB/FhaC/HecB family hemolysin secretion/activation protein [Iodidimonas sp. SYSU 1G8]|uniref:ShlB/FhaC/HecB family hemolysin secretion/activation protein n=1 Tax=Iodidimonas sp. SYSU 1G8 TaxID=3133967 RepID=UPI0031FF0101
MAAIFVMASQSAVAQQLPSAGSQFQQIPQPLSREKLIPELRIDRDELTPPADTGGAEIRVNALRVSGATRFSEAELIVATGFTAARDMSLSDLRVLAGAITAYYNERGYFVAQAYIPAQDIGSGTVTIAVIEGQYGAITLDNQSNLSDSTARSAMPSVKTGDIVAAAPLERGLLLLSDIPGVRVKSTLSPGSLVGTSDLTVGLTPGRLVTGSIEADNAGSRYTGNERIGGLVSLNNPLGWGDVASFRVLTSGDGLRFFRGSYQGRVGNVTVGVAYGNLHYELGKEFKPLDARGSADVFSLYASYPLIRSYDHNLHIVGSADAKSFRDKVGPLPLVSDKRVQVVMIGLNGDLQDGFLGGGATYYAVNVFLGHLDIRTPAVLAIDQLTARADGQYYKLAFNLARSQNVAGPLSLYASVRGQIASKNLDSSEKMELGGAYAVRAYPEGEGYGDEGFVATIEARVLLPRFWDGMPGQMQLALFADTGRVTIDHTPWFVGDNHRSLSTAGIGFTWAADDNFVLRASYAHRIGGEPALSAPDKSDRVWIHLAKFF